MKIVKKDIEKIKNILFIVCIILLIFQNYLQSKIFILRYFDEFLAIFSIPFLAMEIKKIYKDRDKISKEKLLIILSVIGILISGLIPNLIYGYQNINVVFSDCLLIFKFFMVFYLSGKVLNYKSILKIKDKIIKLIYIITIFFVVLTILNYVFNLFPSGYRFGIPVNKLFYSHCTQLAATIIFLIALYLIVSEKISKVLIITLLLLLFSTLRFKAIGVGIFVIFFLFYISKSNKAISLKKLLIVGALIFLLAFKQISYYFIEIKGARRELTVTSFEILKDYFPFGTGFGTYGSYLSGKYYSPVYYLYGLDTVQGITPRDYSFISDTFFPMIIGQFGFVGTICYCYLLYSIFKQIQSEYNLKNKNPYAAKMICLAYLLISSTSESAFVNPIAIPFAIILGININNTNKTKIDKKNNH